MDNSLLTSSDAILERLGKGDVSHHAAARSLPSCLTGMNLFQQETPDRVNNKYWLKGKT